MKGQIRALLLSNSTNYGQKYLDHAAETIVAFLGKMKKIVFVPYAIGGKNWDAYTKVVRARFEMMGIELVSVHELGGSSADRFPLKVGDSSVGIFVGGGNTFRLQQNLWNQRFCYSGSIPPQQLSYILRRAVLQGAPYIGVSAGINVACPTIKTTNDMPIVGVNNNNMVGLDLVPYQINPHYVDADPNSPHMGETREQRIKEFHEENNTPVVGLREGSWICVEDGRSTLGGPKTARLFLPDKEPTEISPGAFIEGMMMGTF